MPRDIQKNNSTRDRVLHSAATLFLERGYAKASIREIAKHAGANRGSVLHVACNSKETLLQALVPYVLEGQFRQTQEFLAEKAADPVLFYAAETTLQLYMMENSEQIRELYLMAYRLPDTAEIIRLLVSEKLAPIFRAYNPDWVEQDFHEAEIASGGVISAIAAIPCGEDFPMERKVRGFLQAALRIYRVPEEKIAEAIAFVSQFDFAAQARLTIDHMLAGLEQPV